ncbi:MAG: hypothetical protein NC092_07130 [Butyrivibrio sp.]|nr:hypothetical protein [Muribaculum sp.]MCM1552449.1 hypothetical protein [Butyrivibrio sp.]
MKGIALLLYLIWLAVLDWRERRVPLSLLWGGCGIALGLRVYALLQNMTDWRWLLVSALLGILPGLAMLAVARITGKAGYGDGFVLLNVGLWTDYKTCILVLCFSMLFMSAFSAGALLTKRANRQTKLPYIPFLAAVYAMGILV